MPSVSKKQHNLMAMVANDPAAAKRTGVPQSVGAEYVQADKGKKFGGGSSRARPDLQKANKPSTRHGKSELFSGGGMATMKKKAPAKKMAMGGYADGGMPMVMKDGQKVPAFAADGKGKMKHGGMAMKKMAHGGMTSMGKVKTAAPSKDGVAQQGKTKGKQVVMAGNKRMNKGGRTC